MRSLIGAMAAMDHDNEYHVFVSAANRHLFERRESNFHMVEVRLPRLPSRRLWEIAYLHLSSRMRGLDLVHLAESPVPLYQPAKALATVHDILPALHPERFPLKGRLYYQTAFRLGLKHLSAITVASEQTKRDLTERYSIRPEKVKVIPHGFNPSIQPVEDSRELARVRSKYRLPERFLLYLGTVEPRKNLGRLIGAFRRLRQQGLAHSLVIAGGKGWLYDDVLRAAQEPDIAGYVHFAGFVDDEDLSALYSAADLFVYPSLYEGFGVPPLEAMAAGVPVVCSNRSSLPEVVGGAALLVDPEDEQEIAAVIWQAVHDPNLRARLRSDGFAQARLFSWERTARETLALYRDMHGAVRREEKETVRNAA